MMHGSSGATLYQRGDLVKKVCTNAHQQVQWFKTAQEAGTINDVRTVRIHTFDHRSYTMQHVVGHLATAEPQTTIISRMYAQVNAWSTLKATSSATWQDYILRLREHAEAGKSIIINDAVDRVASSPSLPSSFCHGDLTLENIIIDYEGIAYLIDPNSATDLYQSWVLDCGKLLQSTHTDYHNAFTSNSGINLDAHDKALRRVLDADGIYTEALVACLSHIVRLTKYRLTQISTVEALALPLMKELGC